MKISKMTTSEMADFLSDKIQLKKIILDVTPYHSSFVVPIRNIDHFDVDYDAQIQSVICAFTKYFAERQMDTFSLKVDYPSSWWQAFKKQYFPRFLLNRFPVKMAIVEKRYEVKRIYPTIAVLEAKPHIDIVVEEQ